MARVARSFGGPDRKRGSGARTACGSRRPGFLFLLIDAALMIAVALIAVVAFTTTSDAMTGILTESLVVRMTELPKYEVAYEDGAILGNYLYDVYGQMGLMLLAAAVAAILIGAAASVMESRNTGLDIRGNRAFVRLVAKPAMLLVFIAVWPAAWDMTAYGVEGVALWVLNPLYSFDPERPCPAEWTDGETVAEYRASMYIHDKEWAPSAEDAQLACGPELKVSYLVENMGQRTRFSEGIGDMMDAAWAVSTWDDELFTNIFMALPKLLLNINVVIMVLPLMALIDVFLATALGALPVLAGLSMVPRFADAAKRFLPAIPALAMYPILSSVVLSVGAGYVAELPGYESATEDSRATLFYAWLASTAVVLLAALMPLMLVAGIQAIYSQMTPALTQATRGAAVAATFAMSSGMGQMPTMRGISGGGGSGAASLSSGGGGSGGPGGRAEPGKDAASAAFDPGKGGKG